MAAALDSQTLEKSEWVGSFMSDIITLIVHTYIVLNMGRTT